MLEWIKLHFIPTDKNAFQPHFLRVKIAGLILLLVIILEGSYLLITCEVLPRSQNFAAIFASVLIEQTNDERNADLLSTLRVNEKLELAARLKAEDMAAKGYFAHDTPDGKTPWYWFEKAGYDYAAAGENLAVNFTDSQDVTEAWMRSPTHRANIMNGNYTEIGIATARGTYKGKDAIFVVQEFGRPSIIARQTEQASSTVSALTKLITEPKVPVSVVKVAKVDTSERISNTKTTKLSVDPQPAPQQPLFLDVAVATDTIPTSTTVAGADIAKLDTPEPIVLEPVIERPEVPKSEEVTATLPSKPSKLDEIIASPRQTTTTLFFIIGAILALSLGLTLFIKIRIQHPHIIANGILLLAIIISILMLNEALGFSQGVI